MGLFDFTKNAGRKIFGDDDEKAPQTSDVAAAEAARKKLQQARAKRLAEDLARQLASEGVDAGGLKLSVTGDRVKVSGKVRDQATKEKVILALGNVAGVAAVEEDLDVESTAAAGSAAATQSPFYTVQKGDTLSKIAKQHYGDANQYRKIFEANKPLLDDPDKIYPGQSLRIPKA